MMPPGFAVAAMAVAVLVSGEINMAETNWSDACKGPVCSVAEKQAEGLARLRVLSDYIKETMALMESVVSSLDDEMMEVGQELSSVVGRRCHSRGLSALTSLISRMDHTYQHETENNFIEVTSDQDDTWASRNMTQGSTSTLSGDVGTVLGTSHITTHRTSQHPSSGTYSTSHSTSQRLGSTPHSSSTVSQSTGKTVSRRPSSSEKYEAQPSATMTPTYVAPEQTGAAGNWQRGSGRGQGIGRGQGMGRGQSQGRGQGRGGGRGWNRGQSSGRGQDRDEGQGWAHNQGGSGSRPSKCRGVPVGSPHYVPGLDNWCEHRCRSGDCPSTHCVC